MNNITSQSAPLLFEPNSLYLLFIMQGGRPHSGVFHHHSDNMGRLAYTDGGLPGLRKPRNHPVFLFELDLNQRIETMFNIITAHKVASLDYHKWLPNPHFVSAKVFLEEEDKWMTDALCDLDREWKRKRLVWTHRPDTEPPEFRRLAGEYTPTLILVMQAYYLRQALYGAPQPQKRNHELELYAHDTWT